MEVKAGYKQTEIGTIPDDWAVVLLKEVLMNHPTYGINAPAISYDTRFPTYLRITDISEDGRFLKESKASVNHPLVNNYELRKGDIVFARTGASVGKSYLYDPFDGELVFAGFLIRIRPDTTKLVPAYLKYFVQSSTYWNWVKVNSMRSGQPGINGQEFASLQIPLPHLPEQEAIAEALSDADALIASLEQLIAKKRSLKQGAMQALLTGQQRLPGFEVKPGYQQTEVGLIPLDWALIKLGEQFIFKNGLNKSKEFFGYGKPIVNYMDVYQHSGLKTNDLRGRVDVSRQEIESFGVKRGDVFFTRTSETPDEIGISSVLLEDSPETVFSGFILRARPKNNSIINDFKKYCFSSNIIREQIISMCTYTTRALTNGRILSGISLPLPPTIAEQEAIATLLSDMDSEIATLEAKLGKARQLKQGMMQELLTGRIRLV